MAKDDSKRVRDYLTEAACRVVDGDCSGTFQHWFPFDERVPPTGADGCTLVYFDNVAQNATTLSGGGATVEEGVLVVDFIFSQTQFACGSVTIGTAYAEAGRAAQSVSFTVGSTVVIGSANKSSSTLEKSAAFFVDGVTPEDTTSKITITQQPIVGPGFKMRRNNECHIPVQIGYRAVTNGPD